MKEEVSLIQLLQEENTLCESVNKTADYILHLTYAYELAPFDDKRNLNEMILTERAGLNGCRERLRDVRKAIKEKLASY